MKLTKNQLHLGGADGIRAIACLAVIFHHFAQRLSMQAQQVEIKELQAFFMTGNTGVSIFFVLSGFLLAFPFWRSYLDGKEFPSIRHYVFRRAVRIVPAYYAVFIVCLLLVIVLNIQTDYLLWRTLAGLTFTSGFHYITFFPSDLNGPFWSISFEVFCYALMPLIMLGMFKVVRKKTFYLAFIYWIVALIGIFVLNTLIHYFLTPNEINRGWQYGNIGGAKFWMPNYNPIGFFAHFTIGILAAGVASRLQLASPKIEKLKHLGVFDLMSGISLLGAFVMLWLLRHANEFSFSWQQQPFFYPYFPILMAIPLAVGSQTRILHKLLDNQFLKFTARISFGLYLWHYLFITLVSFYLVKDYNYMGIVAIERWALISLAILAFSYVLATLSYYFLEKPVLDWAQRRQHTKRLTSTNEQSINLK